jgi:hypothetical protein
VIGPFQLGEINVLPWNVLNGRIRRFAERQGVAGIGNHLACDGYNNAGGIALDGDRMIWTWKLGLLFFHVLVSPFRSCSALQKLLVDETAPRVDDYAVAAVHHERGLSDLVQISTGIFRRSGPAASTNWVGAVWCV